MKTVSQIRAEIEAAKILAMNNFERNWGTRDVSAVVDALRQTIPTSINPADAARKARALIG
jgi:hypothetical protein